MKVNPLAAWALGTMATTASAGAQELETRPPSRPVTLAHTDVHALHSESVGGDFEIWVARPVAGVMPLPPGPRSVLYVLDANLFFGTAVEMTRIMSQLYGELPPLHVVGIAYPTDDPALQSELRSRDFTPTADAGFAEMAGTIPGARPPTLPRDERLGGADRFLAFLTEEVQPLIAATYPDASGDEVLFGSSLGGLFALHTFFRSNTSFAGYIATSPAIWWDDNRLLAQEAEYARSGRDLPSRLVLAVGELEEDDTIPMLARFRMVSNVRTLSETLQSRAYPSLSVTTLVLDGESHTSVVPSALTRGLRVLFPPRRMPGYPEPDSLTGRYPMDRRDFVKTTAAGVAAAATPAALGATNTAPNAVSAAVHTSRARPLCVADVSSIRYRNGGRESAIERGFRGMTEGEDVLEALVAGVNIPELDPEERGIGFGGLPNADGNVQLDSCLMHGPRKWAGGVAAIEGVRTPSLVAKAVAELTDHHLIVGEGAREFAKARCSGRPRW